MKDKRITFDWEDYRYHPDYKGKFDVKHSKPGKVYGREGLNDPRGARWLDSKKAKRLISELRINDYFFLGGKI